jgi:hypothetical protein
MEGLELIEEATKLIKKGIEELKKRGKLIEEDILIIEEGIRLIEKTTKELKKKEKVIKQLPKKLGSIDINKVVYVLCSSPDFTTIKGIIEGLEEVGLSRREAEMIVDYITELLNENPKKINKYPVCMTLGENTIREIVFRVIIEELERELEEER